MSSLAALRNTGTAAAVNDNTLVHLAGAETLTGPKTFGANMRLDKAGPEFLYYNQAGAANERYVRWYLSGNLFVGDMLTDAGGSPANFMIVTRSAQVPISVNFPNGVLQRSGNTVWDQGNDGAGSGLDADLLDGLQGSAFAQVGAANVFTQTNTFQGIVLQSSAQPETRLQETDAGADAKYWWTYLQAGVFNFHTVNDAFAASNPVYTISRSGALATVWEFFNVDLRMVVAPATGLSTNSVGFRSAGPSYTKTANYTFVVTDEGRATDSDTASAHAFTINTGVHTENAVLYGANRNTGVMTLTAGAGVTFRDSAGGTSNPTVAQYQQWSARRQGTTNIWFVRVF